MADRVIVVGASRGNQTIPVAELKQMMGRAGRTHDGSTCLAEVVVSFDEEDYVLRGLEEDEGLNVVSEFSELDSLIFHAMPDVSMGRIRDKSSAIEWFGRSLSAAQGGKVDVDALFGYLEEVGAVQVRGDKISATPLGDLSASFYFHPADVLAWKMNFTRLFEEGLENHEVAPAWALGNVPVKRSVGHFGKYAWVLGECMDKMPLGMSPDEGCKVSTTLWWHCMGGPSIGDMKSAAMALREDFPRIRAMLGVMNARIAKWDKSEWLDGLELRVKKSLVPELVPLCRMDGINKSRALHLYNMGVCSSEDVTEDLVSSLDGEIEDDFLYALRSLI